MKKILAIVLVLAILVGCAYFVIEYFASKPNIDEIEAAKTNLEDADYTVIHMTKDGLSGALLPDGVVEMLSASKDNDDNDGLVIMVLESDELAKIRYNELKAQFDYSKKTLQLQIDELKYTMERDEAELSEDELKEMSEELDELKEELKDMNKVSIGRSGATVWYCTKNAAKDSRD